MFFALLLVGRSGMAQAVDCYEAPGTMNNTCVDLKAVRANGDLRAAPIYSGGPKQVRATGFTLVTNCRSAVSTLQDRDGANFGGGGNNSTPAIQALSRALCGVAKPRVDGSIRQF